MSKINTKEIVKNNKKPGKNADKKTYFLSKISNYCDKCGAKYTEKDVTIVSDNGAQAIIHFKCTSCLAEHFANYIDSVGASNKMPFNSDMRTQELMKFLSSGGVTADDVIDVYEAVSK